ncbi:MAG: hypothetical protein ABL892_08890 [Thiobacillaceae bacterium]
MSNDPSSNNPLLGKMDALMNKHRGHAESKPESAMPEGWLPVLTEVVKRGTPPVVSPTPSPLVAHSPPPPAVPIAEAATAPPPAVTDTLAEQLLSELAPKLSEVMEKQVAAELRKSLDETVASLLSQLDVNVREIVRDAVAEKLKAHKPDS